MPPSAGNGYSHSLPLPFSLSFNKLRPLPSNLHFNKYVLHPCKKPNGRRIGNGALLCRAEFSQDAPLAVAIGACILNSLVFQIPSGPDDGDDQEQGGSVIDSTDARFAVMGIISFIPYFNWLSWVFAWLDTGKRRYAVYSLVYLAPYLRSNLSLSPEDSWLPIASIVFCIVHIQLEASIKNGDFQGFRLFREISKKLSSVHRETESHLKRHDPKKERNKDHMNLPPAEERSRNKVQGWRIPQKPIQDADRLNENADTDDGRNQ